MTTRNKDDDTGCCGCFGWLFSRRRRRAAPEEDDVPPEATLPVAEDTLGQGPPCPAPPTDGELPEPQLEVEPPEPPEPQAEVELPEQQLEVEPPEPQAEVELPEPLLEVEPPEPEAEVELPEPLFEVEPPEPEAEVELPEQQLEVDPPEPEAEVELPEPLLEVEPPEPRPEADTVRKCVRFHLDNLPGFVKDRELYGDLPYYKYGVPLSVIRSPPHKDKQRLVTPQKGPVKAPHVFTAPRFTHSNAHVFTAPRFTHSNAHVFIAPRFTHNNAHHRGKAQKSLPRQDRRPRYPGPRLVGYYLDSPSAPVKTYDQHRAYNGCYRCRSNGQARYDGRHGGQGHSYRAHYFQ